MIHISETIPIPLLILAICVLMLYPYIGAGILLAVLCAGAGYYWLAAVSFAVCVALHFTMRRHIKPVRGVVAPARSNRRRRKKDFYKHAAPEGKAPEESRETEESRESEEKYSEVSKEAEAR